MFVVRPYVLHCLEPLRERGRREGERSDAVTRLRGHEATVRSSDVATEICSERQLGATESGNWIRRSCGQLAYELDSDPKSQQVIATGIHCITARISEVSVERGRVHGPHSRAGFYFSLRVGGHGIADSVSRSIAHQSENTSHITPESCRIHRTSRHCAFVAVCSGRRPPVSVVP